MKRNTFIKKALCTLTALAVTVTAAGFTAFAEEPAEAVCEAIVISTEALPEACEETVVISANAQAQADTADEEAVEALPKAKKSSDSPNILIIVLISLGIGLIIGFAIVTYHKSQLKSVKFEKLAHNYIVKDSFSLSRSNDIYLYSNVTKTKRQSSND